MRYPLTMKVKDAMSRKIITATPKTSVYDVWKILYKKHVHGLPIVDRKNQLLGIVSEEDILRCLYPKYHEFVVDVSSHNYGEIEEKTRELQDRKAEDIMNKKVQFIYEGSPMMKALSKLIIYDLRQLPVLNEKNHLIGMISKGDIFDVLFTKYLKK